MHRRPKSTFGVGTALGVLIAGTGVFGSTPAWAAAPTIDNAPAQTGYGDVVLTGTATPGATVYLREAAYIWGKDATSAAQLARATPYTFPTTATAGSNGQWSITRSMDSGFVWAVEAGGEYSRIIQAPLRIGGEFTVTPGASGSVAYRFRASPDQPWFPVALERQSGSTWVEVANGYTDGPAGEGGTRGPNDDGDDEAEFQGTATGQPTGQLTYRVRVVDPNDPAYASAENLITTNTFTATTGGGSGTPGTTPPTTTPPTTTPPTTTPPTTPPTTRPTTPPTTAPPTTKPPTPKPTTPKPTTPKPTTPAYNPANPAVGAVQFSRIQYNAPGTDTRANKSINGEYVQITNRSKKSVYLYGWTIRDAAGNLYRIQAKYWLYAGRSLIIRTGKGANSGITRYWLKPYHVWGNSADTAYLRTATNRTIDTCKWTKPGKGYTTC